MTTIEDDPASTESQIAQRVRLERDLRNLSLAELSERSGVSKAMISKIEREEVSPTAAILARRIAHTIGTLVGRETIVEKGRERFIEAGDILVLVRKRDAFVNALTRELKRRGDIPVAGADRLVDLVGLVAAKL